MRTTLTIDIGILAAAKDLAARQKKMPDELASEPSPVPASTSVPEDKGVNTSRLPDCLQLTDSGLLLLARAHNGQLPTIDNRLGVNAVHAALQ